MQLTIAPYVPVVYVVLLCRNILGWFDSWATLKDMPQSERLQLLIEENKWKNSLVMWLFPQALQDAMPHVVQTWLRCWILCAAVYFGVGAIWAYYGYFCFGDKLYAPGAIPAWKDVAEQMKVSFTNVQDSHYITKRQ
jgi:lathosterol oxidase